MQHMVGTEPKVFFVRPTGLPLLPSGGKNVLT